MVDMLGSFISAVLQVLLDRIANPDLIDFFRGNHLDEALLEKLKMLLLSVTTVLNDAEEKQFVDPLVKEWVDRLKSVAYDADDVLDEIATKAIQDKMDPGFQTTLNQVKDYASSLNPFSERVQSKIGRIVERLKSILEHKNILGLNEGGVGKSLSFGSATTSLVDEHHVYGRHDDREKIIDFLLAGDSNGDGVPVVAVVGMGGIGKTTLAQILYNDERVINHFQSRSWAFVSDTSNVYEITKKVFESFTLSHSNISDLNILQIKLKHRLARQRFLLVLDGFQNENFLDWDILQRPFLSGNYGSRIIVTTRSQSVATLIRADLTHSLSLLSHDDTWKLFASHAFKSGNPNDEHPILAQIGQKIVKRCNGLPLAAKALGSLLRTKVDHEEWKCVCYSRIWELPSDKCSILPALRLSYSHLPSHLKRCFTYCSIFPKGFEIQKQNLIYLWMAEGILQPQKTKKRMEDVGEECFQELLSRSFFYRSTYHISHYMMHDLIHDVAQFVAGEFYYNLDDNNPRKITISVRHLSYLQGIYDDPEKFEIFSEFKQLRTFIPFKFSYFVYSSSITSMVSILLPKLKRLRVLSLSHYPITKLPDSIGNLLHLRYLDLSYTEIECLPDSISSLYNLETLLLSSCRSLNMLPENMSNLVNLRQLDISGSNVTQMPAKFGKLKSLQLLTSFVIGNKRGSKISELGELSKLHGALLIEGLQNVVDPIEASHARLKRKKYLRELEFKWTTITHDQESETNVLDMLEPHKNVERLKIQNFGGNKLPNWLGSTSFSNMVFLHLANCENCKSLPSLGQLSSLTELCISKMKSLQKVGQEFYGNVIESFRLLKILKFEDMPIWEEWSTNRFEENGQFPSLLELYIERCPKLTKNLPDHLPSLDKLVITSCQALTNPMPRVPRLRELVLTGCDALSSLSEKMMQGNKCLQFIVISNCSSLVTISVDSLPSTLRSLEIYECRNLQLFHSQSSMQQSHCYSALEKLHLKCSCDSLISFPLLLFNKLEDLQVQDCSNLQFISSAPNSLPHFRKLKLKQCSKLAQFHEVVLHAPNLESLSISKCVD
ncbi:hypothetical protein TSUD_268830, partial [Trifolium subterraneum]